MWKCSRTEYPAHGALEPKEPQLSRQIIFNTEFWIVLPHSTKLGLLDPELVWGWLAAEVKSLEVGSHALHGRSSDFVGN